MEMTCSSCSYVVLNAFCARVPLSLLKGCRANFQTFDRYEVSALLTMKAIPFNCFVEISRTANRLVVLNGILSIGVVDCA